MIDEKIIKKRRIESKQKRLYEIARKRKLKSSQVKKAIKQFNRGKKLDETLLEDEVQDQKEIKPQNKFLRIYDQVLIKEKEEVSNKLNKVDKI